MIHRAGAATRPPNRRELIITAASEQFLKQGFSNVAMTGLAEQLSIVPSAIYHHFSGKRELLAAVMDDEIAGAEREVEHWVPNGDELAESLARLGLGNQRVMSLWLTTRRHLAPEDRRALWTRMVTVYDSLKSAVAQERPDLDRDGVDLLTRCVFGITQSPTLQRSVRGSAAAHRNLAEMITMAINSRVADYPQVQISPRVLFTGRSPLRREVILSAAVRLFAADGYTDVGLDAIGREAGIAGPTIYKHFQDKPKLLAAIASRGYEALRIEVSQVLESAEDPVVILRGLLVGYSSFTFGNTDFHRIFPSEARYLTPEDLRHFVALGSAGVGEWAHFVRLAEPGLSADVATARVRAVHEMINQVALDPVTGANATAPSVVIGLAGDLLGLP